MSITDDIKIINEGLSWLKEYKPEQYEQSFFTLVNSRRLLNRQLAALKENPAIGAFGESQTGKSYQINTLLNRTDKAFLIKSTDCPDGVSFVDEINPQGDDREATGVVTRLTSFRNNPSRYSKGYPVLVKLLTPGQLVCILASGFYQNIVDYTDYTTDEMNTIAQELQQRYSSRQEIANSHMTEDDVLDTKNYLKSYVKVATQNMRRSKFFETVARLIRRVPESEWGEIFKYLWHSNQAITGLFNRLVSDLSRLNYASEVYTPLEAVMHHGNNRNTIMSVACLNGLDESNWSITTPVFVREGNSEHFIEIKDFPTCDLSAISAEIIYKIDSEYLDETLRYEYDESRQGLPAYLPAASYNKLSHDVSKSLLAETDLLDFPGARMPEQQNERDCTSERTDQSGQSVLVKLFLRGKIAYLFNHYSESHMMKVLMFCHHQKQSEVKNLHILLDQWVRKNVGNTSSERALTLQRTGGISPLMLVATKINIDMTRKSAETHNTDTALNNRWEDRFRTVLLDAVLNWTNADWFKNWSGTGQSFKDTYLLRSYEHSSCIPGASQMFRGYIKGVHLREDALEMDAEYYGRLRNTFINNGSVRELFFDPELAWDVTATLNNDGSLYIIERMGKVAQAAAQIRQEQMKRERDTIMEEVKTIFEAEYDSDSDDEKLEQNITTAGNIHWELDSTCNFDNYYFGHLIQALQVTEVECLGAIHSLVHGTQINNEINNIKDYELIRKRCNNFEGCTTEDEKWHKLMTVYRWSTKQIATERLEQKNIDPAILFEPTMRPKTNEAFISDNILELWHEKIGSEGLMNTFTGSDSFSPVLMKDLTKTLKDTAERLHLADRLAEKIKNEVNITNLADVKESLVADMMASLINGFVNDFGYSMLTEEQKAKARIISDENYLDAFEYIDKERKENYSHDELSDLFARLQGNGTTLSPSFDNHYNLWLGYMTIAYIVHLKRSQLKPEVNRALGDIISRISF